MKINIEAQKFCKPDCRHLDIDKKTIYSNGEPYATIYACRKEDFCRRIYENILKSMNEESTDYCTFDDIGYLGELSCSKCGAVIGTAADTQRMRFCPYCGSLRKVG